MSGQNMSEPLSSTEIEDVLSSIRRLVSDDMRPTPRAQAPAPASAAAEAGGKLILTPALRVVESRPDAPPQPGPAPRLHLNFPAPSAAPRTVEINPEPASIETVVASLGAAVDATKDDWEAENGDADIASMQGAAPQDWGFHEDDEAFDEIYAPDTAEQDYLDPEPSVSATSVEAGWAEAEDMTGPEEPAAAAAEPDPLWVDAAEASVIAALAEQAAADEAAFGAEFAAHDDGDDAFRFNEDVLRELVRDILREELAGSMGERITRNIRKLVRAEIARSFAAQELG